MLRLPLIVCLALVTFFALGADARLQPAASGVSAGGSISADGRYVAFYSSASDLVLGDSNEADDAFVRDLSAGATERVSVGTDGTQANASSTVPVLSADGRYVAFSSGASNLVTGTRTSTGTRSCA